MAHGRNSHSQRAEPQAREHSKKEALAACEAKGQSADDCEVKGFPRV